MLTFPVISKFVLPSKALGSFPCTYRTRTFILLGPWLVRSGMALQISCALERYAAAAVLAGELVFGGFGKSIDGVFQGRRPQIENWRILVYSRWSMLVGRYKFRKGQSSRNHDLPTEMRFHMLIQKNLIRAPELAPRVQAQKCGLGRKIIPETVRFD